MTHPFAKIFEKSLRASSLMDNQVIVAAEKIKAKGYREAEIIEVLKKMQFGRIDDTETEILTEALEHFEGEPEEEDYEE